MILYKYVSSEAGLKILESNSLGFTQPCNFNDPFELKATYPHTIDKIKNGFNSIKRHQMSQCNGVLSLTRQPLNPLMWAHYGESHTGMVIGIDCSISEFTCEKKNLVPVQFGNVIYTNEKPNSAFISKAKTNTNFTSTHNFPLEHLERLQRTFLFKGMCWSYEEEVRIVKCIAEYDNRDFSLNLFNAMEINGKPMFLYKLPENAIKSVYLGARANFTKLSHDIKTLQPKIELYGCKVNDKTWDLEQYSLA